jgi:3-methylcrotonyl-CoA carboxylase alpha subunit
MGSIFVKILIANRGEIARRIAFSAQKMNFEIALVCTIEDSDSIVASEIKEKVFVTSYLNGQEIIDGAKKINAQFIHPGYGFLSENPDFSNQVEKSGIIFIGATSLNMKQMGSKEASKQIAHNAGVPTLQAILCEELKSLVNNVSKLETALQSKNIFSPFLVKASGGGGGRGMRVVNLVSELPAAVQRASDEALAGFNDATVFVERYLQGSRHIEIQVFGDGEGGCVVLGERECSLQRRHQKVIEECPSAVVNEQLRRKMGESAFSLVQKTKYKGAGTVEFLVSQNLQEFFFLEMNTRLQVEHPVTEIAYGFDLVEAQILIAQNKWPDFFPCPKNYVYLNPTCVALEARVLAENPKKNFLPTPSFITYAHMPNVHFQNAQLENLKIEISEFSFRQNEKYGVRIDSGVASGFRVNSNYDSLISKLIVWAPSRAEASALLAQSASEYNILGCLNNLSFIQNLALNENFLPANYHTNWIEHNVKELTASENQKNLENFIKSEFQLRKQIEVLEHGCYPWASFFIQKKEGFICAVPEGYFLRYGSECCTIAHPDVEKIHVLERLLRGNAVQAPMAGKVLSVHCEIGQKVQHNDLLFVMESMKIQMEIRAPGEFIVKEVLVKEAQIVSGSEALCLFL